MASDPAAVAPNGSAAVAPSDPAGTALRDVVMRAIVTNKRLIRMLSMLTGFTPVGHQDNAWTAEALTRKYRRRTVDRSRRPGEGRARWGMS
ncbi:hypothetical protein GCM10028799_52800 [Kribbella italica]